MDTTQLKTYHIILSWFVYIAGVKVLQNRDEECCFARETNYIKVVILDSIFIIYTLSLIYAAMPL